MGIYPFILAVPLSRRPQLNSNGGAVEERNIAAMAKYLSSDRPNKPPTAKGGPIQKGVSPANEAQLSC
ncbi:MAG: hypothetical protein K2X77_33895 [Candidatus Obscuribacterales bacterium]|nr:hypothetical protein [Candidatus Obscuribacterales bacterium]